MKTNKPQTDQAAAPREMKMSATTLNLHALRRDLVRESLANRRGGKTSAEADARIAALDAVLWGAR